MSDFPPNSQTGTHILDTLLNQYNNLNINLPNNPPFSPQSDNQNTFFLKLHELSRLQIDAGNFTHGLANIDKCIEYISANLPEASKASVLSDFVSETVTYLNEVALDTLKADKPMESLRILEKCRELTHPNKYGSFLKLRGLTYNHIGCCFRRLENLEKALFYLQKALQLVQGVDKMDVSGITHINLCAVLSQLQDHQKALEQAKLAVSDCAYDLIQASTESGQSKGADVKKKATLLAIAYHNLGIEESFCANEEAALQAYFKAYKLIEEHISAEDKLYIKFKKAHDDTLEKVVKGSAKSQTKKKSARKKKAKNGNKEVQIKKPTVYSNTALTAKVYLQNGRVVVPNFTDYKEPTKESKPKKHKSHSRPQSGVAATKTMYKTMRTPSATSPQQSADKVRQRPLTAGIIKEFSTPEGKTMSKVTREDSPRDEYKYIHYQHLIEDRIDEYKELILSDNEASEEPSKENSEADPADLKSNRVSFLSHLNYYSTHVSPKGTQSETKNLRQSNEGLSESLPYSSIKQSPTNRQISIETGEFFKLSPKNEPPQVPASPSQKPSLLHSPFSHISERTEDGSPETASRRAKKKEAPETFSNPKEKRPVKKPGGRLTAQQVLQGMIIIQKNWRGYRIRKLYKDELQDKQFITVLTRTVTKPLERRTSAKTSSSYYVLMMYNHLEDYISIHIKNLVNRRFYKAVIKPQRTNILRQGSLVPVEELAIECNDLLRRLTILDGCIVILEDSRKPTKIDHRNDEKALRDSHAWLRNSINYPDTINTIPVDESEMLPSLIKKKPDPASNIIKLRMAGKSDSMPDSRKSSHRQLMLSDNIHIPVRPGGDTPKTSMKSPSQKSRHVRPYSGAPRPYEENSELDYSKPKAPTDNEDEGSSARLERRRNNSPKSNKVSFANSGEVYQDYKSIFAQSAFLNQHILEFKLFEKTNSSNANDDLTLSCYDLTAAKTFKSIEVPRRMVPIKELKVNDLIQILDIDLSTASFSLKRSTKKNTIIKQKLDDSSDDSVLPRPMFFMGRVNESPTDKEETESELKASKILHQSKENSLSPNRRAPKKPRGLNDSSVSDEDILQNIQPLINRSGTREVDQDSDPSEFLVTLRFGKSLKLNCLVKYTGADQDISIKYKAHGAGIENPEAFDRNITVPKGLAEAPSVSVYSKEFTESLSLSLVSTLNYVNGELIFKERRNMPRRPADTDSELEEEKGNVDMSFSKEVNIGPLMSGPVNSANNNMQLQKKNSVSSSSSTSTQGLKRSVKNQTRGDNVGLINPLIRRDSKDSVRKRRFTNPKEQSYSDTYNNEGAVEEEIDEDVADFKPMFIKKTSSKIVDSKLRPIKSDTPPSKEEDKEELPDLQDKDVQNATLKIQQAYMNKKNKKVNQARKLEPEPVPKPEPKLEEVEEMPDLNDPGVQNATASIQKAFRKRKAAANNKQTQSTKQSQQNSSAVKIIDMKQEADDDLPDLNSKDVQAATLSIQKAYKKRMENKTKPKTVTTETKPILKQPQMEEEELPNLEDPAVQNATKAIQKAYMKKKNLNKPSLPEKAWSATPEFGDSSVKKIVQPTSPEIEEDLPDLNAKDVQDATFKIQNAYKRRKDNQKAKQSQPLKIPPSLTTSKAPPQSEVSRETTKLGRKESVPKSSDKITKPIEKLKLSSAQEEKIEEEIVDVDSKMTELVLAAAVHEEVEEELPDLQDKDVQKATLAIQMAYLKKKKGNPGKQAPSKTIPAAPPQQQKQQKEQKQPEKPKEEEEAEELPNINDPDVQNATLAIQKAYLKRKAKKDSKQPEPKPKSEEVKKPEPIKKDADDKDEELPDLADPGVQNATLAIQKAYMKRKQRQNPPKNKPSTPVKQRQEAKDEELPNLEDADVQKATLAIQKAYIKKKSKASKVELVTKPVAIEPPKPKEEEEELPNINDPDVQNATLAIQKAYMRRKAKQNAKAIDTKPAPVEPKKTEQRKPEPEPEPEPEEELPDLKDPGVQHATLAIQKAYLRKKKKLPEKTAQNTSSKPTTTASLKYKDVFLPNELIKDDDSSKHPSSSEYIQDEEISNITASDNLYVNKGYRQRMARSAQELSNDFSPPRSAEVTQTIDNSANNDDDLPDLNDTDVQRATMKIQEAYKNRISRKKSQTHSAQTPDEEKLLSSQGNSGGHRIEKRSATEFHTRNWPAANKNKNNSKNNNNDIHSDKNETKAENEPQANVISTQFKGASWRSQRSYTGEIPRIVIHLEDNAFPSPNKKAAQVKTEPEDSSFEGFKFGDRDGFSGRGGQGISSENSREANNTEESDVDGVGGGLGNYLLFQGMNNEYTKTDPDY